MATGMVKNVTRNAGTGAFHVTVHKRNEMRGGVNKPRFRFMDSFSRYFTTKQVNEMDKIKLRFGLSMKSEDQDVINKRYASKLA